MKRLASALIAATALVLGAAPSSEAEGFRGHQGFKGGFKSHHGFHAGFGFKGHGGLHPGFHGHGFRGHPGFGTKIFIGVPLHGHHGFRPFAGQVAPNYVQQEGAVWYYCERARAYYPDVQECPDGWGTVTPPATTSPSKESWE